MKFENSHSQDIKKNIRHTFWLFFVIFAVLVMYIVKFIAYDSKKIIENSANPRISLIANEVVRGKIFDSGGNVVAETDLDGNRKYPYGKQFAHLVGFSTLGQSGVEGNYNFSLQKLDNEIFQRINHVVYGDNLVGNNLVLTVDGELQKLSYELLGKQKGAIVIMEPSTGKILAMVSYPTFDPNDIAKNWDEYVESPKESPLLNRATQGLYPPGSVFKILVAAAAYENMENYDTYKYNCEGTAHFGDKRIRCFDTTVHGEETILQAFTVSCNTFFAEIGTRIGAENLKNVANRLLFNQYYKFPMEFSQSSFVLDAETSQTELVETSIGQGKTLTTPVHMAMIVSAIANGGLMMEPYILDRTETSTGKVVDKTIPKPISQVFTFEESEFLKKLMINVVNEGTGTRAKLQNVTVAAKTGTAENGGGEDHGWFVSFAPAEKPTIAVSIVLENSGGPRKAADMTKEIIQFYTNKQE